MEKFNDFYKYENEKKTPVNGDEMLILNEVNSWYEED